MTHAPVAAAALAEAGIGENLVRLSIGLENTEDLVADVLRALDSTQAAASRARLAVAGC
jgi:cystathionine gamma-synthase